MIDWYTDELFFYDGMTMYKNDFARIVFVHERFRSRDDEDIEHVGMGAIYEKTCDGRTMRTLNEARREELLQRFYNPYHAELTRKVYPCLMRYNKRLIIDGYFVPSKAVPYKSKKAFRDRTSS